MMNAKQIKEAKQWLINMADMDARDVLDMTDNEIECEISSQYEGGCTAFVSEEAVA